MKIYQRPDVTYISLEAEEKLTADLDLSDNKDLGGWDEDED